MARLKINDSHYLYLEYVVPKKNSTIIEGYENEFKITFSYLKEEKYFNAIYFFDNDNLSEINALIKWLEKNIANDFKDKDSFYISTDDYSDCVDFIIDENGKFNLKLCLESYYSEISNYINIYDIDINNAKMFLEELNKEKKIYYYLSKAKYDRLYNNNQQVNTLNNNYQKKSKKYGINFEKNYK